jgi:hypothetical protein
VAALGALHLRLGVGDQPARGGDSEGRDSRLDRATAGGVVGMMAGLVCSLLCPVARIVLAVRELMVMVKSVRG